MVVQHAGRGQYARAGKRLQAEVILLHCGGQQHLAADRTRSSSAVFKRESDSAWS